MSQCGLIPLAVTKSIYTGAAGSGFGMFLIGDGIIVGADVGGMKYDGTLAALPDGSLEGAVKYTVSSNVSLVTGVVVNETQEISAVVRFPANFATGAIFQIDSPSGPLNVRLEYIRDIPNG